MNFSSHNWEIGNISCYAWASAYTTTKLPLSFLQIGELRWESSSALHCPMTSQWSSADIKTGQFMFSYSQLRGQKRVKTTQMLKGFAEGSKQPPEQASREVPQLSKRRGKRGRPSLLHASQGARKSRRDLFSWSSSRQWSKTRAPTSKTEYVQAERCRHQAGRRHSVALRALSMRLCS